MNEIHEETPKITPGFADASGRFGVPDVFRALMDMAAIHAELIGVGFADMAKRGLFWLTVKTRIDFFERPRMSEEVKLVTWPEAPERIRGNRSYLVKKDGRTVITGRTEWAVINVETGKLAPMKGVYPEELALTQPPAGTEPFSRIPDEFSPEECCGSYRVVSTDIDVGRHMNNAAYVKALMGFFSNTELESMDIRSMEVLFKAPCFEGDELKVFRRSTETGWDLKMARRDVTAILARISL